MKTEKFTKLLELIYMQKYFVVMFIFILFISALSSCVSEAKDTVND